MGFSGYGRSAKVRLMELALNFAWMMLAAVMCLMWIRHAPVKGMDRRTQFVALALVILIMFPVISVTDDLMLAQNPAETSSSQRKDHLCANPHITPHPIAEALLAFPAEPFSGPLRLGVTGNSLAPLVRVPTLDSIQNRPPPAA